MARRSQVALHPRRAEIEYALVLGFKVKALAQKYGIDQQALYRYKKAIPQARKTAILAGQPSMDGPDLDELKRAESKGLLTLLISQRGRTLQVIDQAAELGDLDTQLRYENLYLKNVETEAKLLGELGAGVTVNTVLLAGHPEWLQVRHLLSDIARKHPAIRADVLTALRKIEAPAIEGELEHAGA